MSEITLTIDGIKVRTSPGSTILEAARKAGIKIPTLCWHEDLGVQSVCRLCVVEVNGARPLQPACSYPAADGMVVRTNTPAVRQARRLNLELLLARHPDGCLSCARNLKCELQQLAQDLGIRDIRFERMERGLPKDESSPSLVRDPNKCINCRRCLEACESVQSVATLSVVNRGFESVALPAFGDGLMDAVCVMCGQCSLACPTGAITERDDTERVWAALADPRKHVVVQTAPAVRVSLGEELGLPVGAIATGKMVAALRRLGFDRVFDTDFTADLTIMEEGHELLERMKGSGPLPMFTSCSPGWIKFIEHFYPELLPHVSTCKSPQQMLGALAKTFYPDTAGIPRENVFVVSIMPCTAKKFEAQRPEMRSSGYQDIDVVLTTRELGRMLREAGIDFANLPEEEFDPPLGMSTGAGAIFGATGGVMEAALRTVYEVVTGDELEGESLEFHEVRGLEGVKEAEISLGGSKVRVAVAHGLSNARKVMERVKAGDAPWQFIEIMCCPGGCIGGGGQPIGTTMALRAQRAAALYTADRDMDLRSSHKNPAVNALYEQYLERPLSERSHELLHTHYTPRRGW
ncbi:MAG: 2Fe-2S iron-sulfur cluster binding domain-containing protein [Firmicutes bacterium]|jgi:NADH-quinone oxidoreductase subunit G/NADP-reducing hydrogenase subunit HndD|nr:2Fe-2S iron-sulfur cluster binding domain-containing protein [Bacillota bacterium]